MADLFAPSFSWSTSISISGYKSRETSRAYIMWDRNVHVRAPYNVKGSMRVRYNLLLDDMPLFENMFSLNLSKAADASAILLLIHLYHAA